MNGVVDVAAADWKSDYVVFDNMNGWYVDEDILRTDSGIDFIYGPGIMLRKGVYRVKLGYRCSDNQECGIRAAASQGWHLKGGESICLSRNCDSVSFDFEAKEDVDSFELIVQYNGVGELRVTDVTVTQVSKGLARDIAFLLFMFVILDLCILFSEKIKKNRNTLFILSGIVVVSSLLLSVRGIGSGADTAFHLMRIESIASELKEGVFPVKLSSMWMDGFGYPVSVYYGDILLYIPAIMRIIGFSVTAAYKFYIFSINVGTAAVTYLCMEKIFRRKQIALLTCSAYCLAPYRLYDIYVRPAIGECSAMIFFPIVALAVYRIYTEDGHDGKRYRKNAVLLAVGMSGLVSTHVLSVEMAVVVLAVICLSLWRLTFRSHTLKVYTEAVIATCLFSAYFVVPFLDYYMNVPTQVNISGKELIPLGDMASLNDYFTFLKGGVVFRTPGLVLMGALVAAIVLWVNRQGDKIMKLLTVYSCFILFVGSNLFPWNHLIANYRWGILLSQVQFPWRYIGPAMILLTLLLGKVMLISLDGKPFIDKYGRATAIMCCLIALSFNGNYGDAAGFRYYYDGAELDTYAVVRGEYVRPGTDIENLSGGIASENMAEISVVSRQGSSMELRCIASEENGTVSVPMFHYKGYHVMDESGREYPIDDGDNNCIQFDVPAGYDGTIRIVYKEPWYWRMAEAVSLLSVMGIIPYFLFLCYNTKIGKRNVYG